MAYRLDARAALRSIRSAALSQVEAALAALDDPSLSPPAAAFAVRKRCKKLRALVRLARPALATYAEEDAAFRAVARPLAALRDAEALVASYDRLLRASGAPRAPTAAVRRRLLAQRSGTLMLLDAPALLADARHDLAAAHARIAGWRIEGDATSPGFARTRRRAAQALRAATHYRTAEQLHAWRRHAKYHWHHCRLLRGLAPEMAERAAIADRIAKLLGEHHDLALLAQAARGAPGSEAVEALARARQQEIEPDLLLLGGEIFSLP